MVSNCVRIRASSFSRVNGARVDGRRAFKDVVGAALVVFIPTPTTRSYEPDE